MSGKTTVPGTEELVSTHKETCLDDRRDHAESCQRNQQVAHNRWSHQGCHVRTYSSHRADGQASYGREPL
jgi:hypothetical protein